MTAKQRAAAGDLLLLNGVRDESRLRRGGNGFMARR